MSLFEKRKQDFERPVFAPQLEKGFHQSLSSKIQA